MFTVPLQRIPLTKWFSKYDCEHFYWTKRKSENMNLKFKSSDPDLKFDIQSQFRIVNQNILYLTREVDKIVRMVKQLSIDKDLQQQVDKYFEDDETSPQTDQSTKDDKEPD